MFFHANLAKSLWVEAFLTATFLINRLPSTVIRMESHFYKLFGECSDYTVLEFFGCRSFPYLRNKTANKF